MGARPKVYKVRRPKHGWVCPICEQPMKRGTDREPIIVPDRNQHAIMVCIPCVDAGALADHENDPR